MRSIPPEIRREWVFKQALRRAPPLANCYNPGMRILFVEKHLTFSKLVAEKFLASHEVLVATSLEDARRELSSGGWDVALIDHDDGKGVELVRELERLSERPYIVGISAYPHLNDELKNAGADTTCGKLDFAEIEAVIESLRN
jgi:DNA-binding response OmpR family regulator